MRVDSTVPSPTHRSKRIDGYNKGSAKSPKGNSVPKRKPPPRSIRLLRAPAYDGVGVFCIRMGSQAALYAFRELLCEIGGRGFAVHRLGLGNLYHVRVGEPTDCSCECLGFLRHGHCKHIAGLAALIWQEQI